MGVMTNHIWPVLGSRKGRHTLGITLATASLVVGCSDDPTSPDDDQASLSCEADTGAVVASVSASEVFDWSPACAVALLLVEEGASDVWGISTDDATWNSPDQANLSCATYQLRSSTDGCFTVPGAAASGVRGDV